MRVIASPSNRPTKSSRISSAANIAVLWSGTVVQTRFYDSRPHVTDVNPLQASSCIGSQKTSLQVHDKLEPERRRGSYQEDQGQEGRRIGGYPASDAPAHATPTSTEAHSYRRTLGQRPRPLARNRCVTTGQQPQNAPVP
jgi:hypothetical protein